MQRNGTRNRTWSIAAVALLALAVVPVLASSASAAPVPSGATASAAASSEWAYGGEGWNAGGITAGHATFAWNASVGAVVIYNATATGPTTTELTASRTISVTISASYTAPGTSWVYHFKAVETDHGYANVTNASSVTLANLTTVPALGLLNASLHANASLQASLVGVVGNRSASDYVNVSGWADAQVVLDPSLGLVPLNLTGVTSWSSQSDASGSAAWNLTWSYVNHGWNGTTASHSGNANGTWSATTEVYLVGHVAGPYSKWVDHKLRTAVALGLTGPFDLYAGVLLIPHGFDLFGGSAQPYAAAGVGTTTVASEYLFVTNGPRHLSVQSVTAANLTTGASAPVDLASSGGPMEPAAMTQAASGGQDPTAWEQPESPAAAQSQAFCLQFGCSAGSNPLRGLIVPVAIAAVAAVVAVALLASRRSRGRQGPQAYVPPSTQPVPVVTPPTGVPPAGPAQPPQ